MVCMIYYVERANKAELQEISDFTRNITVDFKLSGQEKVTHCLKKNYTSRDNFCQCGGNTT